MSMSIHLNPDFDYCCYRKETLPSPAEADRKPATLKTVKINAADCSVVNLSTSLLADPKVCMYVCTRYGATQEAI